ncbi:MAG: hypothetical protein AAF633_06355 [Chloroflexota bacterium]
MASKVRQLDLITRHNYTELAILLGVDPTLKPRALKSMLIKTVSVTRFDLFHFLRQYGIPDYELTLSEEDGNYIFQEGELFCTLKRVRGMIRPGSIIYFKFRDELLWYLIESEYIYRDKESQISYNRLGKLQMTYGKRQDSRSYKLYSLGSLYPGTLIGYEYALQTIQLMLLQYKSAVKEGANRIVLTAFNDDTVILKVNPSDYEVLFATLKARVEVDSSYSAFFRGREDQGAKKIPSKELLRGIVDKRMWTLCQTYKIPYDTRFEHISSTPSELATYIIEDGSRLIANSETAIDGWTYFQTHDTHWRLCKAEGEAWLPGTLHYFESDYEALKFFAVQMYPQALKLPNAPVDATLGRLQRTFEHIIDDDYFVELYGHDEYDLGSLYFLNDDEDAIISLEEITLLQLYPAENKIRLRLQTRSGAEHAFESQLGAIDALSMTLLERLAFSGTATILGQGVVEKEGDIFAPLLAEIEQLRASYGDQIGPAYAALPLRAITLTISGFHPATAQDMINLVKRFVLDESLAFFLRPALAIDAQYAEALQLIADAEKNEVILYSSSPIPFKRSSTWPRRKEQDLRELAQLIGGKETQVSLEIT